MNILFLHIGDIHIKDAQCIDDGKLDKIADTLNIFNFDEIILIISGDIAYSGKKDQYNYATELIERLCNKIKHRKDNIDNIHIICVPGNHDVDYHDKPLTSENLQYIRDESAYEIFIDDEIEKMYNFYAFSSIYNCFEERSTYSRKLIFLQDFQIEINLINSGVFSALEEDKGFHFIPQEDIDNLLSPSGANFVITVMHHPPEWYNEVCKFNLEEVIEKKSSIVFLGHQHHQANKTITLENYPPSLIQLGGCLCNNENWDNSSYNIIIFNSDTYQCERTKFNWNTSSSRYEKNHLGSEQLDKKPSIFRVIRIPDQIYLSLLIDEKHPITEDFRDYYIFPRLQKEINVQNEKKEFLTLKSFIEEVYKNKRIIISGGYNLGKTALLKFLFLYLYDLGYYTIFCFGEQIKGKPEKIIKNSFENLYGDNQYDFLRFEQCVKSKKIILVDDFDAIHEDSQEHFFNYLNEKFEIIILSTKKPFDINIIDMMNRAMEATKSVFWYRLMPFYIDKRKALIEKLVPLKISNRRDIPNIIFQLNETMYKQRRFIMLDPDFIISYIEYYCNNLGSPLSGNSSVFSKVFEANLINSINKYATDRLSSDKVRVILSKIAYHIHFNKLYPISEKEVGNVLQNYNDDYGTNVSLMQFLTIVLKAKILVKNEDEAGFYFANYSYLAYYVASELNRQYHETSDDSKLQSILKLACFGINADILLFLTLITDNIKILKIILAMSQEYTKNWEEFDFSSNMPDYLQKKYRYKLTLPANDIKEQEEQASINLEKENSDEIIKKNIYSYDEADSDKFINQIIRALQLLSIVARCLPSFEHIMRKEDKDNFVKAIYELPNKIFYLWATEAQNSIDEIVSFFKEQSQDYYIRRNFPTENEIVYGLQITSMAFLLEIYNITSFLSVKNNTIQYLSGFDYKNKGTYELEHLMMLQRTSGHEFTSRALYLVEKSTYKDIFLYPFLVGKVVEHAFIFSRDLDVDKRQQLQAKFFPSSDPTSKKFKKRLNIKHFQNSKLDR